MKKIYAFFLLLFAATAAQAQRSADLELFATEVDSNYATVHLLAPYEKFVIDGKTRYYVRWTIINHGPDSVYNNDTIKVKAAYGALYRGAQVIAPGDTISIIPLPNLGATLPIPPGTLVPSIDTFLWCDSVFLTAGAVNTPISDPDMTNNYFCENIQANYAWAVGINTVASEIEDFLLYPNPATSNITIKFNFGTRTQNAAFILRDVVGRQVYKHDLRDASGEIEHEIDVNDLPRGMYLAELHYNGQTIISKLMIQ